MKKYKKIIQTIIYVSLLLLSISCTKEKEVSKSNSLNNQLDGLEKIITKYEKIFKETDYGSPEYTDVTKTYNKEISVWSRVFEINRYKKDRDGKKIYTEEFKVVEKRFFELNNKMTKVILSTIPKKNSRSAEVVFDENDTNQRDK